MNFNEPDLSLVSNDALLQELFKRTDHAVFLSMKNGTDGSGQSIRMFRYQGMSIILQGLLSQFSYELGAVQIRINKEEEDSNGFDSG